MKLREHAEAVENALYGFFVKSMEEAETEEDVIANVKVTAYFITELAKRWAERRYVEKQTGKEMTIEEAVQRSQEATTKFFERKQRRRAPREMRAALQDTADLRAFLDGNEEPDGSEQERQENHEEHQSEDDKSKELEYNSNTPTESLPDSTPNSPTTTE